jgi:hypothetical protein
MKSKALFILLLLTLSQARGQVDQAEAMQTEQLNFDQEDDFFDDGGVFLDEVAFDVEGVTHEKQQVTYSEMLQVGAAALWQLFVMSPYTSFMDFLNSLFEQEKEDEKTPST